MWGGSPGQSALLPPKGSLAHTHHSSHRAASPRVYFATMSLLYDRPYRMIAESGMPARVRPVRRGDFAIVCSINHSI